MILVMKLKKRTAMRVAIVAGLLPTTVLLALAGRSIWTRYRESRLDDIRRVMDERRYLDALGELNRLARFAPGDGEIWYRIGMCERSLGRLKKAAAAWRKISADSRFRPLASLEGAKLALSQGKLADAEEILESGAGLKTFEGAKLLARILQVEGRIDDVKRLYRAVWNPWDDPIGVLSELWKLDVEAFPIERTQKYLDQLARDAPDDDRILLARAHLAILQGDFTEARRMLEECARRRPNDFAIWKGKLKVALLTDSIDDAIAASKRIPISELLDTTIDDVRARLAALSGDESFERSVLLDRLKREPGSVVTLDRLAELAVRAGESDRSIEFRRRGAVVREIRKKYEDILAQKEPRKRSVELADLADRLGMRFEAERWAILGAAKPFRPVRSVPALDDFAVTLASRIKDITIKLNLGSAKRSVDSTADREPVGLSFVDDAERAGLIFRYENGSSRLKQLPETMNGGVALFDYDGDGRLDVYAVQGGVFPPDSKPTRRGDRLFRNRGDGTFEDATEKSGLAAIPAGYGHGVAVGDYDGDGFADLFITRWRKYELLRNRGDGTFEDATEKAGLAGDRGWPTSAAWADLDGDGDLDLYVCQYLEWDADRPATCVDAETGRRFYCTPRDFHGEPDRLFRNDGGRFVDATDDAGIVDRDGRGLGVVATDLDGDRKIDIFVANDMTANYYFHNKGGLKFEEIGLDAGVACNGSGGFQAGMGIARGDFDRDGAIDLFVTNFYGESTTFFRNLGGGVFADHTSAIGLAVPSRFLLGFGLTAADFNNDGLLDIASANGHVNDGRPRVPYAMPAQLLMGRPDGRLFDASSRAGSCWSVPRTARGLARGDLDDDGALDVVIVAQNAPLAYFHNRSKTGRFITLTLEGVKSPRDGSGTRIEAVAGGKRFVASRDGGGSYESASDPRIHFGLGAARIVESIAVEWPSGTIDRAEGLEVDCFYKITEGSSFKKIKSINK